MKKLFVLLIAAIAGLTTAAAQNAPEITFKEEVHDFGTFPEESGKVTCTFEFTNTGKADLVLQNVRASCGCTTPEWTKTPVKPGESGIVTATYNATGRPGRFSKTITVTSNGGEKRLIIKGEVTPKVPKIEDQYPFDMDGLRIKNQNVYLNNIDYPAKKTERIQIVNTTKETINLSFSGVPSYITVKASPEALKPDEKGTIDLTLDSKAAKDWGSVNSEFYVVLNKKVVTDKKFKISVFSNIVENFSSLTPAQKAEAPVINVGNKINVGELNAKSKKTLKFSVTNDGKSDLIIRKGVSNNDNIKISVPTKPIKPGKKEDVKIEVNSDGMKNGKFTNNISLISNDPNKSTVNIQLEGEVK